MNLTVDVRLLTDDQLMAAVGVTDDLVEFWAGGNSYDVRLKLLSPPACRAKPEPSPMRRTRPRVLMSAKIADRVKP